MGKPTKETKKETQENAAGSHTVDKSPCGCGCKG